ncbi:ester cyclase [Streptomyces sp. NPDC048484]|uniref:ester cyclase n=1 Tax=Streptomyces sp. NPDC048484 TaxID=3155146 RepID=UPI00341E6DCE
MNVESVESVEGRTATTYVGTRRRRARLLIPAVIAALALTIPAAAANTAPTAGIARTVAAPDRPETKNPRTMLDSWIRLWNGDFEQAPGVISRDFRVHAALLDGGDGSSVRGVDGLVGMIRQIRAPFPDLRFAVEVGPLIDGRYASLRWTATGTYAGGFPGAKAEPGTVITFTGNDTLRMKNGKFVEYWLNADTLRLLTQLKAL